MLRTNRYGYQRSACRQNSGKVNADQTAPEREGETTVVKCLNRNKGR